jgi:DNA-binding GntR family transcriptional regulator
MAGVASCAARRGAGLSDDRERALSPYERIKKGILAGTFPPEFVLAETALAELCGVSRTPIREALGRLLQDGLVTRTDRGMAVRARTPEEILDIYETRIALEGTAARMAALRHTRIDRSRLERLRALAEEADETDGQALADRNRELHRGVWMASHNLALIDLLERLDLHLLRYPITTLTSPGRWAEALREHQELLSAVFERDAAKAQEIAEHHFVTARDIRLSLWDNNIV